MTTQQIERGRIPVWGLREGLRKAREDAGLEQGELAAMMDVSRNTVSAAERGTKKPRRTTIVAWAFATGVDPEWLLALPRLDSNQQPFGRLPGYCSAGVVVDLDAYRGGRQAVAS